MPTRRRVTLKVNATELRLLFKLKLPKDTLDLNELGHGWVTVYQHPTKKHIKLTVYTRRKPPKKRTFKVKGSRRLLRAVSMTHLKKEAVKGMAPTKTRKKSKSKKSEEELELEELENLEDLDDEDLDDEEPEDEDEDDEDEDEEDEDDEDEEEAPKKKGRGRPKGKTKTKTKKKARKKVEEDEDEDEEDDEDEEEKPRKKSKASKGKKGKKTKAAPGEKIASGKLSPADVADRSDGEFDARQIRLYLRANEEDWPKGEGFRYAFTKKEADKLIKEMKRR